MTLDEAIKHEEEVAEENQRVVDTGIVYESITKATSELGLSRTAISNCLNGRAKTAGGYHWEFVD